MSILNEAKRHPAKLRAFGYGSVMVIVGLAVDIFPLVVAGLLTVAFGIGQLVKYWGSGGHLENDCHICGERTETGLVTCKECQEIVPNKAFVLECEWCEECWYSNSRLWNTFRSLIHSRRAHPDEMEAKYGTGERGERDA